MVMRRPVRNDITAPAMAHPNAVPSFSCLELLRMPTMPATSARAEQIALHTRAARMVPMPSETSMVTSFAVMPCTLLPWL